MNKRIYPKLTKEKLDKEFDLLHKKYKQENPNFGLIKHPKKNKIEIQIRIKNLENQLNDLKNN